MNISRSVVFSFMASVLSLGSLLAEEPPFAVTIVSPRQELLTKEGRPDHAGTPFPIIRIPTESDPTHEEDGQLSGVHFYVVVRNVSEKTLTLSYWDSDWYDCVAFEITAANGKVYPVRRAARGWFGNSLETWIARPGEMRVLMVDFTARGWTGIPSQADLPRNDGYQIKAIFTYQDKLQKSAPVACESPQLEAHSR